MLTLSRAASSSLHRIYHHPRTMRTLTPADLNPAVLNVQYAVRGELAIKADELTEKLRSVEHQLPFKKVINSNIGNPQQKGLDQPPITFPRQVCLLIFMLASACCIHRPYLRFGAHPRIMRVFQLQRGAGYMCSHVSFGRDRSRLLAERGAHLEFGTCTCAWL